MLDFFHMIGEYLSLLWSFVTNLLGSLISLFGVIIEALTLPQYLSGYLFPILGASVLAVFSIGVLKLILGR